jgi:ribosomal protein S18 acetylase RimI-like enzyme
MPELRATPRTARSTIADWIARAARPIAIDERHAYRIGNRAASALDWAPVLGNLMGAEEGARQVEQGVRKRSIGDVLMGAGGVALSALPGGNKAKKAAEAAAIDLSRGFHVFRVGPTTLEVTSDGQGYARLNMIKTPPEARGRGAARAALSELTRAADEAGIILDLNPEAMDATTSAKKLREFYAKHGFVPNKGRHKDFYTQAAMIRSPKR